MTMSVFCLCLCFASMPQAQETLTSVQRDLDRVEREIEREKDLHKQERKRATEFDTQKAQRLQALKDQIAATNTRTDSLRREVDKARRKKSAQAGQSQFYAQKTSEFRKGMSEMLRRGATSLREDFPYQKEKRVSDWEELAKAVEENAVTPEDAVTRFAGLIAASLEFASSVEVYAGVYRTQGGNDIEGSFIRIGAASMSFIAADGKVAAVLYREGAIWKWRDADLPTENRDQLIAALRVAQGKEAPRLVPLPFIVHTENSVNTEVKP